MLIMFRTLRVLFSALTVQPVFQLCQSARSPSKPWETVLR